MSIYNRDYMREGGGSQKLGQPTSWNMVSWLLAINAVVFVANLISVRRLEAVLGLSFESLANFFVWTPVTYQFTHGGVLHFIGNMIGLFFLGRLLMQLIGPRKLLRVYLLGGLAGGFLQVAYNFLVGPDALVVGASGAVMAILIATAAIVPHQSFQLLLFFVLPIRMTLRTLALIVIAMDAITLIVVLTGQGSNIAVFAHIGGMLFGWLYVRSGAATATARPRRKRRRKKPSPKPGRFGIRILRDGEGSPPTDSTERKPFVTNDVDAILDKINEQGFQSLTEDERKILEKSSSRLSRRLEDES